MRFSKGTTDHDGDGRMGGSRKGGKAMAKAPKKVVRKAPRKDKEDTARIEAEKNALATAPDPQTGMGMVHDEKPTKAAILARRKAVDEQFAAADAKGGPTNEEVRDATLGRVIRGW